MHIKLQKENAGFGTLEVVIATLIMGALAAIVVFAIHENHPDKNSKISGVQSSNSTAKAQAQSNTYAGWNSVMSERAGFSIKYPTSWKLDKIVGKDNIEYITLNTDHFNLTISSYIGTNPGDGGQIATTCEDCKTTITTNSFNAGKVGTLNLQTIAFDLDSGSGKAMILRKTDGTYYIPSPSKSGVVTSFRGLSKLSSLEYYQEQTSDQFIKNPDFTTAQRILESLSY